LQQLCLRENNRLSRQPFLHFEQLLQQSLQPHEASQQLLQPQSFGQPQLASQQPLLQPHEASQQLLQHELLRANRLSKQQRFFLQQLLPQHGSLHPHEASQQPWLQPQSLHPQLASQQLCLPPQSIFLAPPKRRPKRQQRCLLHPQQVSQHGSLHPQLASQQPLLQQSFGHPHDFSQQQDGSQQSQPQPLPSILSIRPAP
jgi:hypothetical protein